MLPHPTLMHKLRWLCCYFLPPKWPLLPYEHWWEEHMERVCSRSRWFLQFWLPLYNRRLVTLVVANFRGKSEKALRIFVALNFMIVAIMKRCSTAQMWYNQYALGLAYYWATSEKSLGENAWAKWILESKMSCFYLANSCTSTIFGHATHLSRIRSHTVLIPL